MAERALAVKTVQRRAYVPHGEGWRKVPSVRPGGSPHFWTRYNVTAEQREWYCWDRVHKTWIFSCESRWVSRG